MELRPVVLCIEEDVNRAYSLVQIVKGAGLQARIVRSLSDAAKVLRVFMPDAVVVRDFSRMRHSQLTEFAQQLRVDSPIFLLTRHPSSRWRKLRPDGVDIFMGDSDLRLGSTLAEIFCGRSARMEEPMTGEDSTTIYALMLSGDKPLVGVAQELAKRMAMGVEVVPDLVQATRRIATRKYQSVLLDWRNEMGASTLLSAVRGSTSNATDVVFAFVANGDHAKQATRLGANFVIPQPFTADAVGPYLRAGYGLIIQELRKYFRSPISIPIKLHRHNGAHTIGRTLNLSAGGLAVRTSLPLSSGEDLAATFRVPGWSVPASVNAIVCWTDNSGRAGLRFSQLVPAVAETLQSWLAARVAERLSQHTARVPADSRS